MVRDDADTLAQLPSNLATEWTGLRAHSGPRPVFACVDILKDTASAMEYDFNIRLSILVGQVWTESKDGKVSPVIRSRTGSLSSLDPRRPSRRLIAFPQLYLWGIEQADLDLTPIKASLHQLIESQDSLQDIIVALWDNGAVVTKAAQQLYLHRQFAPIQD
ncbi:MAG: hypothetical protein ACLT8H_06825 [Streptococcus parasanguinis]